MKDRIDCKIVQDLLPNYIEKLTSEETNKYVEEHLRECKDCKKILKNMEKDFEANHLQKNLREVQYIKKYSDKLKTLKTIIIIILIIVLGIVIHKYFWMRESAQYGLEALLENSEKHVELYQELDRLKEELEKCKTEHQ